VSIFHTALVDKVELVDIEPTKWMACKAVLRAIANHANEDEADLAWPGVELLMLETGGSESVITRTTALLAKRGWITKKRRSGTSNMYRLNVRKLQEHQADRGEAKVVFMAKHLAGLEFPGEDLTHITHRGKPVVRGRSTARERAQKKHADQPTRQIDVLDTSDCRDHHVDPTSASGQIDDLAVSEPGDNKQATGGSAGGRAARLPDPAPKRKPASGRKAPETPGAHLLRSLRLGKPVTDQVIRQHHEAVTELLSSWPTEALAQHLEAECQGARNPMGRLVVAIRDTQPWQAGGGTGSRKPEWCGKCDEYSRHVDTPGGGRARCRDCNPNVRVA
jgi:DNA-binding transcriptional ArsR family regulator